MDSACTYLPRSSTNETKLLLLYLLLCHHKVFHLLHVITMFCFTVSLFLLCVCTCARMKSSTMILLPAQHDQHFLFENGIKICYATIIISIINFGTCIFLISILYSLKMIGGTTTADSSFSWYLSFSDISNFYNLLLK